MYLKERRLCLVVFSCIQFLIAVSKRGYPPVGLLCFVSIQWKEYFRSIIFLSFNSYICKALLQDSKITLGGIDKLVLVFYNNVNSKYMISDLRCHCLYCLLTAGKRNIEIFRNRVSLIRQLFIVLPIPLKLSLQWRLRQLIVTLMGNNWRICNCKQMIFNSVL